MAAPEAKLAAPAIPPVNFGPTFAVARTGTAVTALISILAAAFLTAGWRDRTAVAIALLTVVAAAPLSPMAEAGGVALPMRVVAALGVAVLPAVVTLRWHVPVVPAIAVAGPPVTVKDAARIQI